VSELPRWECRKAGDEQKMTKWVNDEIDRIETVSNRFLNYGESVLASDECYVKTQAIEQADQGNIEPLRRLLPEYARFLCRPKQGRGKRFPKDEKNDRVGRAVDDVTLIRALWQQHYGRKNRPKNDPVTAEQIAADRWKVDVEAVVSRLKKAPAK
jgi:hypothetical protein